MMATITDYRFTFDIMRKRRKYKEKQTHTQKINTTIKMIENKTLDSETDHRINTKHNIPTNKRLNVKQWANNNKITVLEWTVPAAARDGGQIYPVAKSGS